MGTLLSPGVSVQIIDESFRATTGPGTIPLIIMATATDKPHPSGTGIAVGTQKNNAGKLYLMSSQREMANTFGDATFYKSNGSAVHGNELNEYGLFALHSYLGVSNRAYVIRADIDLNEIIPKSNEPTTDPANGTIWFDTSSTSFGLFKANGNGTPGLAWDSKKPIIIDEQTETENVVIGNVGYTSADVGTALGVSGNLNINGTNVVIATTDSFTNVVTKINTASITGVTGVALIHGERSWLKIFSDCSNPLTVGGDAAVLTPLGLVNNTTVTYPKSDIGLAGDYAVMTYQADNLVFEKIRANNLLGVADPNSQSNWYVIGSASWKGANPTVVVGSTTPAATTASDAFSASDGTNSVTTTLTGTTVAQAVTDFNAAVTALAANVRPSLFAQSSGGAMVISNWAGGPVTLADVTGTPLSDLGISSKTGVTLTYSAHTSVPSGSVSGSTWIKTTQPDNGSNWVLKTYNSSTSQFTTEAAMLYATDDDASNGLGINSVVGTKYIRYNVSGTTANPVASFQLKMYAGNKPVDIIGSVTNPTLTAGHIFTINGVAVTLTGSTVAQAVIDINNTVGLPSGISASDSNGQLKISNTAGLSVDLADTTGVALATAGIVAGTYSNWVNLSSNSLFVQKASQPTSAPTEDLMWYKEELQVDIMVSDGNDWKGYRNSYANTDPAGPILSASQPTTQSDGTPLVDNDLWIDTSDLENYPKIYRYSTTSSSFSLVNNTDQTTPFGIVFGDARWTSNGQALAGSVCSSSTVAAGSQAVADFLVSDYVDPDAPNPQSYPAGVLLFNTRYSSRNVKQWKPNHLTSYVGNTYQVGSTTFPNTTILSDNTGRWVTVSGNQEDGSPYTGRKAQRIMVVRALASVINTNDDARARENRFNIMACPGYPELLDEMVNLNTDRGETSFIVVDTPARLNPSSSTLQAWATNSNNAPANGEDGLITLNTYAAAYYPWGLTSDFEGVDVMVPPSHMMLRTIAISDQKSYPWFAPAGFSRGLVSNVTNVGYLTTENEFQPVRLNQGQRDTLQVNKINPIVYSPSRGIVVMGQKTLHNTASALDRINVVRLVNFFRANFDELAAPFLFEPNDQQIRDAAKDVFDRFLGNMVTVRALTDFVVVSDSSNNTNDRVTRNELWIDIAVVPTRTVEFIFIPVRIRNPGDSLSIV